jgi:uncharacterized repeat protein (TIGR03803 family)
MIVPGRNWIPCTRLMILLLAVVSSAYGQRESVLYSFQGGSDGQNPYAGLVANESGNLYGTTLVGGGVVSSVCPSGCGTVFQLTPPSSTGGSWTEFVLHSFQGGLDGSAPAAGLTLDEGGNLYGTTDGGGGSTLCQSGAGAVGCGTVFRLSPPIVPGGSWTETVLYSFQGGTDGAGPESSVVFDHSGNLYGTTAFGGATANGCINCGMVYELTPPADGGTWTETVVYMFEGNTDGDIPLGGLVFDHAGNLYGTTFGGGRNPACTQDAGCGTVFKLIPSPTTGEPWTERVLHRFGENFTGSLADGMNPRASLVIRDVVLYGTTYNGGPDDFGIVFQLASLNYAPLETVLYTFNGAGGNSKPYAGVVFDNAGNLYGTGSGDSYNDAGAIFRLQPPNGDGSAWTETVLHSFRDGSDGDDPIGGLVLLNGTLYGTTIGGGHGYLESNSLGTVFSVTP